MNGFIMVCCVCLYVRVSDTSLVSIEVVENEGKQKTFLLDKHQTHVLNTAGSIVDVTKMEMV